MSVETEASAHDRNRVILYAVIATAFVLLAIWALIVFPTATDNSVARVKADQTIAALEDAGLPTPSRDFLVQTLGTDGGFPCRDPGGAFEKAIWNLQLTNGAAHVGVRPVLVARNLVRAEAIVLSVYCPDQLATFERYRDGLRYS
ncbi:hypothetical protein [Cryptosporangium aurantiacum]|uniref:Uncharacterized protein n=1 Tax=Cryptosporangium aurantiacum TaxID=134849 RepID=A0A1M7RFN7_9ACTN|nr:hypothetical protein [Cryptosporangium aurantiacum]SHN45093.1 hypothetical protein SAMN05443668_111129 [Cryptosporangium aurantiacum]